MALRLGQRFRVLNFFHHSVVVPFYLNGVLKEKKTYHSQQELDQFITYFYQLGLQFNNGNLHQYIFFCFLTSSSTTRLYRGRAPRQSVWQFYVLPHMRQIRETMTSVSAGHQYSDIKKETRKKPAS